MTAQLRPERRAERQMDDRVLEIGVCGIDRAIRRNGLRDNIAESLTIVQIPPSWEWRILAALSMFR
jgi:hypothetical protein